MTRRGTSVDVCASTRRRLTGRGSSTAWEFPDFGKGGFGFSRLRAGALASTLISTEALASSQVAFSTTAPRPNAATQPLAVTTATPTSLVLHCTA